MRKLKRDLNNMQLGYMENDAFIEEGKMAPTHWIKDERQLKEDSHTNRDYRIVSGAFNR